jgi:hypothetical protein
MNKLRKSLSPATLIATAAVLIATSGTAIAAGEIITSSNQIANGVVQQQDQANPHLRASVDAAGKLRFGGDAAFTQRLSTGHYRVAFRPQSDLNALNLDRCAVVVSPEFDTQGSSPAAKHHRAYALKAAEATSVDVFTFEEVDGVGEIPANTEFDIVAAC